MTKSRLVTLRTALAALVLSAYAATASDASFISPVPDPFLNGSEVLTSPTAISTVFGYTKQFVISNFNETSNTITGGNDAITYTATFTTQFYSDAALTMPNGGPQVLSGTFNVTLTGRTTPFQTGTFAYSVTSSTFTGVVGGQTLTTSLSSPATGTSSITSGPGSQYTIDDPGSAPSQYSVNGGTPVSIGTLGATSISPSAVPEPATLVLLGQAAVGLLFLRKRKIA